MKFCFFPVVYIDIYVVEKFRQIGKSRIIDKMNPACVEKKGIMLNLVSVAVFCSSQDWVASELVARK